MEKQSIKEKFDLRKSATKITQDDRQTRATIPRHFVTELDIQKGDEMEWEIKEKKLKGELKQND